MCGIVYAQSFDGTPVNNGILQQFDKQRTRGTQGFGLFDGREMNIVRAAKESKILKWLCRYNSDLILFHHRFPTSTINVKQAAHPFATGNYFGDTQYILVHNGVISNAHELFEAHQEFGIEYHSMLQDTTYNDSESLLWDFALTMEGKQDDLKARGSIAFICIKTHKGKLERMYFGRNSSPLNMLRTKQGLSLSSEGEGESIDPQMLYNFNYAKRRLTKRNFNIPQYSYKPYAYGEDYHYTGSNYPGSNYPKGNYDSYAGDWLPDYLRNRYSKPNQSTRDESNRDFVDYDKDGNEIVYEHDKKTQMYLPIPYKYPDVESDVDDEEAEENFLPSRVEIENLLVDYLIRTKGNFEQAYWLMETDYSNLLDDDEDNIRDIILLEKVMDAVNIDPEYVDEDSISSIWRALWAQTAA